MKLNEYQKSALETATYPEEYQVLYPSLGLAGEAGEVADKVKKVIRDDGGVMSEEKRQAIAMEIGDVLWYCAVLAHDLGFDLSKVAEMNIKKLRSRKERGVLGGSGDNR